MKCEDCRWWTRRPNLESVGTCHKLPPIVKIDDYGDEYWHWPITSDTDWCTDWCGELKVMDKPINIIFDGPPSHKAGRFIEVETDDGKSINAGEWIDRKDGTWALRITALPIKERKENHGNERDS